MKKVISFLMMALLCLGFTACNKNIVETGIWSDAIYTEDTELGQGDKTVFVEVIAEEKSVTFTIHSDKDILGDALVEHGLIEGEKGPYGLYIKKVNGITADYDIDQCYWGINKDGESVMTGVDGVEFEDAEHYELVYTKQVN